MASPPAPNETPGQPPRLDPDRPRGSTAARALTAVAIALGGFGLLGGAVALAIVAFGDDGGDRSAAAGPPRRPGRVPAPLDANADADVTSALRAGTCRRNDVERQRPTYLTAMRGRGAAAALRGKVALVHFKMVLPAAAWTPQSSRAVTVAAKASRDYFLAQAARAGVADLRVDAIEWSVTSGFVMPVVRLDAHKRVIEQDSAAFRKGTRLAIEAATGSDMPGIVEDLKADGYDQAAFLVHFPTGPRGIRDFAAPTGAKGDAAEFAYILEPDWAFASRSLLATHELLHLFGADDLYDVRGVGAEDGNDIMNAECTGLGPTFIGAATAFGVGWTEAPPRRSFGFGGR